MYLKCEKHKRIYVSLFPSGYTHIIVDFTLDMMSFLCMPSAGCLGWRLVGEHETLGHLEPTYCGDGLGPGAKGTRSDFSFSDICFWSHFPCQPGVSGVLWNYWCLKRQKNVKPIFYKLSEKQKHRFQCLLQPSDSRNQAGLGVVTSRPAWCHLGINSRKLSFALPLNGRRFLPRRCVASHSSCQECRNPQFLLSLTHLDQ